MNGELVTTVTPHDYVRLHGFYRRSDAALTTSPDKGSVDAAVVLHAIMRQELEKHKGQADDHGAVTAHRYYASSHARRTG